MKMRFAVLSFAAALVLPVLASDASAQITSIDIDVVDSSHAPGTGVPVFEGMTARDFLKLMEALSEYEAIGAFDLCEVSPPYDPSGRTAYLAANALVTLLSPYLTEVVDIE